MNREGLIAALTELLIAETDWTPPRIRNLTKRIAILVDDAVRKPERPELHDDELRMSIYRALEAAFPDTFDALIRELEKRQSIPPPAFTVQVCRHLRVAMWDGGGDALLAQLRHDQAVRTIGNVGISCGDCGAFWRTSPT